MVRNGFYNLLGGTIRISIALISVPILISIIGFENYGIWSMIFAAIGALSLIEVGVTVSVVFFLSQDLVSADTKNTSHTLTTIGLISLILALLCAIPFWFGASHLVNLLPGLAIDQQLLFIRAIEISGTVLLIRLLQQFFNGIIQSYQKYVLLNILTIVQSVFTNTGVIVVAWCGGSIIEMMQFYLLATATIFVLYILLTLPMLQNFEIQFEVNWARSTIIFNYMTKMWATTLGSALFGQVDRLIVGGILGPHLLGFYAAITSIATQINSLSALPVQPLLSTLGTLNVGRNMRVAIQQDNDLYGIFKQAFQINAFVALSLGSVFIIFSPSILKYINAVSVTAQGEMLFQIIIISYTIYALNAPGYYILLGKNAVGLCAFIVFLSGLLTITFIGLGAKTYGLGGAVVGNTGFCLTLVMNSISLFITRGTSQHSWLAYIYIPLLYFVGLVISNLLISLAFPDHQFSQIILAIISLFIFSTWFLREQKFTIRHISSRIFLRK